MTIYVQPSHVGLEGYAHTEDGRRFFFGATVGDLVRKFAAWSGYAARDIRVVDMRGI